VGCVSRSSSALARSVRTLSVAQSARERLADRASTWDVVVDNVFETETSLIAYGRRAAQPVVLKIVKQVGDEWRSGGVLNEFDDRGVVRVYEHDGGALLLERVQPGNSLVDLVLSGRDDEATAIIADVIRAMATDTPVERQATHPTVEDWGKAFRWYASTGDARISHELVSHAHRVYDDLCRSQTNVRLLHGDLQHSNILFDDRRGWLAIDPKGVIGEIEYEVGASLRNPREAPAVFTAPDTIARRVRRFSDALHIDASRAFGWAFAQAVLSAIWVIEDGGALDASDPTIVLAETLRRMLITPA
jgi:streptomycin 6-kinase